MEILLLQAGGAGMYTNFIFIGAMILIFWLFLIRPQQKRQNEQKKFMEALQKGEEVVTASGIIGRINKIEDTIITLEVAKNTFIRVTRNSISKEMTEALVKSDEKSKE